jgi:hypothetical protein
MSIAGFIAADSIASITHLCSASRFRFLDWRAISERRLRRSG